jgi:hypothetical protein
MEREGVDAAMCGIIREIIAEIVEVEVEEVGWNVDFWDDLEADSQQESRSCPRWSAGSTSRLTRVCYRKCGMCRALTGWSRPS